MKPAFPAIGLALLLAGCFGSTDTSLQGYIEGTYVYVSAEAAGRVVERPVEAGVMVKEGDVIVRLDDSDEKEGVTKAEALLAQAKAQLANLLSGQRPEEISVIVAELSEARANFKIADEDYTRQLQLREKGVVAATAVDNAKAARDAALAKVESCECGEETSCYSCLRNYSNQFFHNDLRRADAIGVLKAVVP